jgi:hypothetical protein
MTKAHDRTGVGLETELVCGVTARTRRGNIVSLTMITKQSRRRRKYTELVIFATVVASENGEDRCTNRP